MMTSLFLWPEGLASQLAPDKKGAKNRYFVHSYVSLVTEGEEKQ